MGASVIFIPTDTEAKPAGCYRKNEKHGTFNIQHSTLNIERFPIGVLGRWELNVER
jgi:hypothetical protein